VHEKRHGVPFRVITNGLLPPGVATALRSGGVKKASVAIMSNNPNQYAQMMQPSDGRTHADVCSFVAALVAAGVETECTAVCQPGVNVRQAQDLAEALGAVRFRSREYFE
jgi:molybdenum cofactor biosynthesis enzyme MoaA